MSQDKSLNDVCGMCCGVLKPKFRVISTALGEDFNPVEGVDFFLDLNTVVSVLSGSNKFMTKLPFAENVEMHIISNILGILLHWKKFARNQNDARFFLIVNDTDISALAEKDTMKSYLTPYVNKMSKERNKQFVYYWNEAIKRVEIILKYIPSSYFVRCDKFDSYVVPNIMDDYEHSGRHRVIVTGNSFFTNYVYMKNAHLIYSRYNGFKVQQLFDPIMIVQSVSKIDEEIMSTFIKNRVFYNILSEIIGDFDRGIIGLTQLGLSTFAADLLRAVERHEVPENPSSVESVLPVLKPTFHDYLRKAYPLVDIPSHTNLLKPSMIEKVKSDLVDLYDIDSLSKIQIEGMSLLELL
jgi:hypothetical protein